MGFTRPAAVSGLFYPAAPNELAKAVERHLSAAVAPAADLAERCPKALIVPHAGYEYSGPIAGSAYALLRPWANSLRRVLLLGPAHRVPLRGLAAPSAHAFETPLGEVPIDREAIEAVLALHGFVDDLAHAQEHSLEVQLPFLQRICPDIRLVPLAVGDASAEEVAAVLELLWGGPETLIVVSSDLSHYYDYATARRLDRDTAAAILNLQPERVGVESACGRYPVRGLLCAAAARGLRAWTVDLRSSGDTAGGRQEVVGYGAFAFA
jgi:AmmeMemoRadiSam system protein B